MNLVLNEEVDQRYERAKEGTSKVLSKLDSLWIGRAQGETTGGPGDGCDEVRNHEDIVPVVVIRRRDVCPPSASEGPKEAEEGNHFRQGTTGPSRQKIPKADKRKSRAGCDGNEEHEHGSFGISIPNGGRHGREPFVGISVELILDDFVIVKGDAHYQGTQEGSYNINHRDLVSN